MTSLKYQAILCDFDGVLGVTGSDNLKAWKQVLAPLHIDLSDEEYFLREGISSPELLTKILTEHAQPLDLIPELIKQKQSLYEKISRFSFYPGTQELIEFSREHNLSMAVVSGGSKARLSRPEVTATLSKFDAIITATDCVNTKPAPDPYLKAAQKLNVAPSKCIVIENAPLGISSAKNAGMYCIAIPSTLNRKYLSEADVIVDSLKLIPQTLLGLR